ncbi:aminoacyl-histidine dipeptidase [Tolumonas osonensis]|uniref:Cytosol non-specific dipeptidase n=1 Tax=Tolumonas osonensis TaxID=675874 RepID=A0A841G4W7_9GAMM|nr:aminoacyl-histidine dipeptidase [Tolumonas osonensis]MBB6054164.1 dipeptidase D [Tolumonas osonensis]
MSELLQLTPSHLWFFFDKFCQIPRPSKHEAALSQWIQDWARTQGISVKVDPAGNLILKKPATPGFENRQGVILQAHIDMVPQANADTPHDFTRDPIQAYIDGEWVRARGTTLGADNGIGAAACLAALADSSVQHGPLEVLLTVDEEAGMGGAFGLQAGWLEGDILLNTDSEQDAEAYMGCAGGVDANIRFHFQREATPANLQAFRLQVKGLRGGHSGVNIHQDRGNANKLLSRLLLDLQPEKIHLASIAGGTLRNAIPREAEALILVEPERAETVLRLITERTAVLQAELKEVDSNLQIVALPTESARECLSQPDQQRLLQMLVACPNGVIRMSHAIEGVVETSTNLGVIQTTEEGVYIQCLIRSLNDEGRHYVQQMTASLCALAGAECLFDGAYPGWAPDPKSPALALLRQKHEELFGELPKLMVIHAGLECGLFKAQYPHWDMVSFGPTIQGAHSPDERVHIPAVARFWQLLVAMLAAIPEKQS